MKRLKLTGVLVLIGSFALSGCVARTYTLTRDRVDQDTSAGNRGYLMGKAPETSQEGKRTTRTTRVVEIELGFQKKNLSGCPANAPVASLNDESAPTMLGNQGEEAASGTFEKYTVEKNDTLQKISMKFYKTTRKWMKIYDANKDTLKGPDKVYPGQILNIPVEADSVPSNQEPAIPKENLK